MERRHEVVAVTRQQVEDLLGSVDDVTLLGDGKINSNYRIHQAGRNYVLRLYARDPAGCDLEAGLYQKVRGTVPVPAVLRVETDPARLGHPFMIQAFVEGQSVGAARHEADGDRTGRCLGETLARIHAYPFDEGFRYDFFGAVHFFLDQTEAGPYLGPALSQKLKTFLERNRQTIEKACARKTLVHGDYNETNVLVARQGDTWKVAAVLDWEWAHCGSPLSDFGNALRYEDDLSSEFATGFAQGYVDAGGSLAPGWERAIRLVDVIAQLSMLEHAERSEVLSQRSREVIVRTLESA